MGSGTFNGDLKNSTCRHKGVDVYCVEEEAHYNIVITFNWRVSVLED